MSDLIDKLDEILVKLHITLKPDLFIQPESADESRDLHEAKAEIEKNYISRDKVREAIETTKGNFSHLGCRKHWSDDNSGTCSCDENEQAAKYGYNQAIKDFTERLGLDK